MHTLDGLSLVSLQTWARQCATRIALIHAIAGGVGAFIEVLKGGTLQARHRTRSSTEASEREMQSQPAVYFYAGRTYPAPVGAIVLVVRPKDDGSVSKAKASPFDTGGVMRGKTRLPWNAYAPRTQTGYVENHSVEMLNFRCYLERHLSAFFDTLDHYWKRPPSRPIDEVNFAGQTEWRDWTFEIRCFQDVPVHAAQVYITLDTHTNLADRERAGEIDLPGNMRVVDAPAQSAENDAMMACV